MERHDRALGDTHDVEHEADAQVPRVRITRGLDVAGEDGIVIAFNRGVGGAVAGQAAETVLLGDDGTDVLLAPARETVFMRLPPSGGVARGSASLDVPIVSRAERQALRRAAAEILARMESIGSTNLTNETLVDLGVADVTPSVGPLDIELGFLDGTKNQ